MKEMSKARLVAIIYDESLTGSQTMQMLEDGFAGMPEGITLTEPYPKLVLEGAEGDYTLVCSIVKADTHEKHESLHNVRFSLVNQEGKVTDSIESNAIPTFSFGNEVTIIAQNIKRSDNSDIEEDIEATQAHFDSNHQKRSSLVDVFTERQNKLKALLKPWVSEEHMPFDDLHYYLTLFVGDILERELQPSQASEFPRPERNN